MRVPDKEKKVPRLASVCLTDCAAYVCRNRVMIYKAPTSIKNQGEVSK